MGTCFLSPLRRCMGPWCHCVNTNRFPQHESYLEHTLIYTDRLSQSASRLLCHHKMTAEQLLRYKGVAFVYIYIIVALSHVAASQPRFICTHFYHSYS